MPVVPNFLPSTSGLHFLNGGWPHDPLLNIIVGNKTIPIGDAANGLCGGMTFTVRDYFQDKINPPTDVNIPSSNSVLYKYLVKRLFDSFNLPSGPVTYLSLMSPTLPDHETWFSRIGLAPHGRAWIMIKEHLPKIEADIDNGILSPMGIVTIKSLNPMDLGKNHQVLAYRYEIAGSVHTIFVYDPNSPNNDNVTISLDIANPTHTTTVNHTVNIWDTNHNRLSIICFFRESYSFSEPPP